MLEIPAGGFFAHLEFSAQRSHPDHAVDPRIRFLRSTPNTSNHPVLLSLF
jgi:hypothetical protein